MEKWECVLIERIGESGIKIILFLLKKSYAKISDFKNEIGMGVEAIYRSIAILLSMNLIYEKEMKGNIRVFELTEKGKAIAECLKKAEEILTKE